MLTHTDIIKSWPSKAGLYDLMAEDLGVPEGTIAVWKHRGRIPAESWLAVVDAARRRRLSGVTLRALADQLGIPTQQL